MRLDSWWLSGSEATKNWETNTSEEQLRALTGVPQKAPKERSHRRRLIYTSPAEPQNPARVDLISRN